MDETLKMVIDVTQEGVGWRWSLRSNLAMNQEAEGISSTEAEAWRYVCRCVVDGAGASVREATKDRANAAAHIDYLERLRADLLAGRKSDAARAEAAEAERDAADLGLRAADGLLSEGLDIVQSLSSGYDVWSDRVRDHLSPEPRCVEEELRARAEAAEQRAETAEAALAAMPRPEDRCHGEWPCEASTYAASLEAELQQAQADARLILAAFVGANAEGVIEYRMTNADRDAIDVLIESVYDTLEDSLLVATIRRVASIPDNPQETSETAGSVAE